MTDTALDFMPEADMTQATPTIGSLNTVRRVTLKGGLIGALSGESQGKALERVVGQLNEEGYRVTFILPDQWNPFKRLLAFLVLILTLLLYTFSQNVLVVGERIDR